MGKWKNFLKDSPSIYLCRGCTNFVLEFMHDKSKDYPSLTLLFIREYGGERLMNF
jgi:hypothetical protein